ncbi:MAG TPA: hypothetical protein O0W95_04295 [Methanocorpusculum sp.]|nr:hypothetical protein [Methanocorpusculum sp.]
MVDFTTPIPKYSTKRTYEPIEDFTDFVAVKTEFLTSEFIPLETRELKSESFSSTINVSKDGKVVAKIRIDTKEESINANFLTETVKAAYVTALAGTGATAADDVDKHNWKFNFVGMTEDGDEFKLLIDESYAELYDYTVEPATRNSIESWADTVDDLSNPVA